MNDFLKKLRLLTAFKTLVCFCIRRQTISGVALCYSESENRKLLSFTTAAVYPMGSGEFLPDTAV